MGPYGPGPKWASKVKPRFGDLGKTKIISPHGRPNLVAKLADSQGNLYTLGLRTWIWKPLVLVHAILLDVKPTSWAPTLGPQNRGPQIWGSGLGKIPIRNLSPFGFPTLVGVSRQDPGPNPPGHVAKVELWGFGTLTSFLAFPALFPIHPRGATKGQ